MKRKLFWLIALCTPLLLSACVVVPAGPAYGYGYRSAPVYVAPPPVVVRGYWGYGHYRRW